jgi:hypothetical protein
MWKLTEDISRLLKDLNFIAKDYGYFLSLNGSVLFEGYSEHDLDIIGCKYVENPNEDAFVHNFILYLSGSLVNTYRGLFANAYVIEIIIGDKSHLIDLSIRR